MSNSSSNALLRPSLSTGVSKQAPYRQQTAFLVSFFGGPIAAVLMGVLNAQRTAKLPRALMWLVPALLSYLALEWWLAQASSGQQASQWLALNAGNSAKSLVFRLLGLAYFAVIGLAFTREERAATLMDAPRPKGTLVGIAIILAGIALTGLIRQVVA